MALSLKSNSKPAAKKAVVGKSKKKTVWWKKAFIGSSVAVLMLSVGFSGYTWWQNKYGVSAKAYGWTTVRTGGGLTLRACSGNNYVYVYVLNSSGYTATLGTPDGHIYSVRPYSNGNASGVFPGQTMIVKTPAATLFWPVTRLGITTC